MESKGEVQSTEIVFEADSEAGKKTMVTIKGATAHLLDTREKILQLLDLLGLPKGMRVTVTTSSTIVIGSREIVIGSHT